MKRREFPETVQKKLMGLRALLSYGADTIFVHTIDNVYAAPFFLPHHPFGLTPAGWTAESPVDRIGYIGTIGVTAPCVDNMKRGIADLLEQGRHYVIGLRVILAKFAGANPGEHDVYYEVVMSTRLEPLDISIALVTGGCTDCSGGGLDGKYRMDALFALLSAVFEVPIEMVEVEQPTLAEATTLIAGIVEEEKKKRPGYKPL